MRFFLTGATGFLGGALARTLRADGHDVRALVRNPAAAASLRDIGVELHQGDVTDKASMRAPMTGVDGVFHVAGWYKIGLRDRRPAVAINVDGTRHVLELMAELGIRKGVYTSTLAVNSDTRGRVVDEDYRYRGRHLSVYDQTKAEAHRVAEDFIAKGLPLVIVQPGLIYGPGDTSSVGTLLRRYLQRKLPIVPKESAFSWAHVDDEARGHVLAMERGQPGRNYFLAGPVYTISGALKVAESITGIPAPRVLIPRGVMQATASLMGLFDRWLPLPPEYTAEGLRVAGGVTYLGTAKRAARELGWSPRPLRDGLAATLEHEMQQLGLTPRT
ncbi:MAG TPA: NAD-dependent epimerase/dehydratase family protein [Vicinamibacterales bacterium]|nr:NAD-dependent epimerase/dehydratase family protein [Vicinamibacterales bacterium]